MQRAAFTKKSDGQGKVENHKSNCSNGQVWRILQSAYGFGATAIPDPTLAAHASGRGGAGDVGAAAAAGVLDDATGSSSSLMEDKKLPLRDTSASLKVGGGPSGEAVEAAAAAELAASEASSGGQTIGIGILLFAACTGELDATQLNLQHPTPRGEQCIHQGNQQTTAARATNSRGVVCVCARQWARDFAHRRRR